VGKHQISWDSETLPSGTYFVTLELNESLRTKKVVLLKWWAFMWSWSH